MRQRLLAPLFVGLLTATGCTNTTPAGSGSSRQPTPASPASSAQPTPATPKAAEAGPKAKPAKKADPPKPEKKNEFKTGEREIG
jgi:hypothetical protein